MTGGFSTMDSYSGNAESDVESELIDLGAVSMPVLRTLDGTAVRQALRHVLQHSAHPQVTVGGGSGGGERVD